MEIRNDKFNSEIFGIKMGNIVLSKDEINDETFSVKEVIEQGKDEQFKHISVKFPTSCKALFNKFVQDGFYLTDTLFEYIYKFDVIFFFLLFLQLLCFK